MSKRSGIVFKFVLVITALVMLSSCAVGKRAPILEASDINNIGNPTDSCLIFGGFSEIATYGMHDTITLKIETANGTMDASVKKKGFTELIIPFVFTGVPKGDFKATWALFNLYTGKTKNYAPEMNKTTFGSPGIGKERSWDVGAHADTLPAEMSGKCEGGFIWLGVFDMKRGGIFSSSKLKPASKSFADNQRPRYVDSLKEQMKGTAWEAVIK